VLDLLIRNRPSVAAAYFPGSAPPPADSFLRLRDLGYELTERRSEYVWALALKHPEYGDAELVCPRESAPLSGETRHARNLTDEEKALADAADASVVLQVPAKRQNVLHDRKVLLRIGRDVLGGDGVMLLDVASQIPWSPAALAEELAHDADLDISAVYCLHSVLEDRGETDPDASPTVSWLHTHGLGELGGFDLDVIAPNSEWVDSCGDIFRALAAMVLEGRIRDDNDAFVFGHPDGEARLVPVAEFMRTARPEVRSLRDAGDHGGRRSVLCEPRPRRMFGISRSGAPEPLRMAQRPLQDGFIIYFTDTISSQMAMRAQASVGLLKQFMVEFAEFEPSAFAKLGYPSPEFGREHVWFKVHDVGDTTVDATLLNQPRTLDLREGERAERPLELLTDWSLMTPVGTINPQSQVPARTLRDHADEIRAALAARAAGSNTP
jgi:hypothetical protein